MPSTKTPVLHDNIIGGADSTSPAHLLNDKWRTQHNFRLTPLLKQVPHKVLDLTIGTEEIRWLGTLPTNNLGYGQSLMMTPTKLLTLSNLSINTSLIDDGAFRRWSTCVYNGSLYYSNELNPIRSYNGSSDSSVANSPSARYLLTWYDHLVAAYPTYQGTTYPNRVMCSDLYSFTKWQPDLTNEADHYDFVEWQQTDYPYTGVTGLGKLHGTLWVYTPTALIPMRYVGLPKIFQVDDAGVLTRVGNTYPWTLACLDTVHLFFDGIEKMFFAFNGQTVEPIGEPVRTYITNNLNTNPVLAAKMYSYIDVDNREVWWPFVSTASSGAFDKAVVFNYRYKRWFTASVENVLSFCGSVQPTTAVAQLLGPVSGLSGPVGSLGVTPGGASRLFGSSTGRVLREETMSDASSLLLPADDPILETGDFHYGDIRNIKENDGMIVNSTWQHIDGEDANIEVRVNGRDFLGDDVTYAATPDGRWNPWTLDTNDAQVNYPAKVGKILRYQFTFKKTRAAIFSAFSDLVLLKVKAEK